MGLNRLMMMTSCKNSGDADGIKAMLTVSPTFPSTYGYNGNISKGAITPNPLPNGVRITYLEVEDGRNIYISPNVPVTINGITVSDGDVSPEPLVTYLINNLGEQVPVIFNFN